MFIVILNSHFTRNFLIVMLNDINLLLSYCQLSDSNVVVRAYLQNHKAWPYVHPSVALKIAAPTFKPISQFTPYIVSSIKDITSQKSRKRDHTTANCCDCQIISLSFTEVYEGKHTLTTNSF